MIENLLNNFVFLFSYSNEDLIVGAPYYYETLDKLTFGGAFYVYLGDSSKVVSVYQYCFDNFYCWWMIT